MLELACVKGSSEILNYFVAELNLTAKGEFFQSEDFPDHFCIEQMNFIFIPILQKNRAVFEILMNMPSLWSSDELTTIAQFLKHVKWREGFILYYQSTSVKQHFARLPLPSRFRYIRDQLMAPFAIEAMP